MRDFPISFLSLLLAGLSVSAQTPADRVLTNAKIFTAVEGQSFQQSIAIAGDSIVFVGNNDDVSAFIGPNTEVFDMNGKLILPGIHDVHIHTLEASSTAWGNCFLDAYEYDAWNLGQALSNCNISPNSNGWITAFGHSIFTLVDSNDPPIDILDFYFPNTPIVVMEETSHSVWVNSAAMAAVGYTAATPDPVGGHIMIDPNTNQPNGVLMDNAGDAVIALAMATDQVIEDGNYDGLVNFGLPLLAQNGITSMCDGRTYWKRNYHTTWQQAYDNGELTCRVVLGMWAYPDDADSILIPALQGLYSDGDNMLRAHQVKLYSDGITINATAALHEPYSHNHGLPFNMGLNYIDADRLASYITQLELEGYDFHIHAIGDRGVTEALDAIETARNANGDIGARHRITHLEIVDSLDIPRFAELNVIADMQVVGEFTQPSQWSQNEYMIGVERSQNMIPLKSLFDAGAHVTLSSDWDVSSPNPFVGIEHAVTRAPQQLPSVEDAVMAYTINGAYTMRQENVTGSLEVGKLADLICVDQDIFSIPLNTIGSSQVDMTMLGGKVIYGSCGIPLAVHDASGEVVLQTEITPKIGRGSFNIQVVGVRSEKLVVSVIDLSGKELQSVEHQHFSGNSNIELDLSGLSEGAYLVSVKSENGVFFKTQKVILRR